MTKDELAAVRGGGDFVRGRPAWDVSSLINMLQWKELDFVRGRRRRLCERYLGCVSLNRLQWEKF